VGAVGVAVIAQGLVREMGQEERAFARDVARHSGKPEGFVHGRPRLGAECVQSRKRGLVQKPHGGETRRRVVEILTRLGLEKRVIYQPMEEMSRGMQQKVAIARALLSRPRLLLLDEPTTGLDPRSKREVQAVIRELNQEHGTTILLTTHDMLEADSLCDRIAIIDSGKIVALDTPQALKQSITHNGHEPTLEDVFLELTGKSLVKEDEA